MLAFDDAATVLDVEALRFKLENLTKAVNIINHLAVSMRIDAAMEAVRAGALELLDCERVTLFLVFEKRRELRAQMPQDGGRVLRVKFEQGIVGEVLKTGEMLNISDAYQHPLFNQAVDKVTGFRTRSMLCCPIYDASMKTVAVLQALNKRGGLDFSPVDEHNLEFFGVHLGNSLAKAEMHERAEREKNRLSTLFKYFKLLNTAKDLGHTLSVVNDAMTEAMHSEHAIVFLMDSARNELWTQSKLPHSDHFLAVRVKAGEGLVGKCALDNAGPLCLGNEAEDDMLISKVIAPTFGIAHVQSAILQPVLANDRSGKVIAVIAALNRLEMSSQSDIFFEYHFSQPDMDAMALLSLELGDALSARRLEIAYASALSTIGSACAAKQVTQPMVVSPRSPQSTTDDIQCQLLSMYMNQEGPHSAAVLSTSTKASTSTRSLEHWQLALNKLSVQSQVAVDCGSVPSDSASPGQAAAAAASASAATAAAGAGAPGSQAKAVPVAVAAAAAVPGGRFVVGSPMSPASGLFGRSSLDFTRTGTTPVPSSFLQARMKLEGNLPVHSSDTAEAVIVPNITWTSANSSVHFSDGSASENENSGGHAVTHPPCFFGQEVLLSWSFDMTAHTPDQMNRLCYDMFVLSGVVAHFHINITKLGNWLAAVASHYHNIHYHNFNHACHVLHCVWMMVMSPSVQAVLNMEDRLALLISALCHDMDHDGCSNSYHMNVQSELARIYSDRSVMENHHCALAFEVLRRKDCGLLDDLDLQVRRRIRKVVIGNILCTDMSNHFTLAQECRAHDLEFDKDSEADRLLLGKILMHAADISNACRPFAINDKLSSRVHREFEVLAARERELGIPITFNMDSTDPLKCAQTELNFLDYIVRPLWERVAEIIPEMQEANETILDNRMQYAAIVEQYSQRAAPSAS